MSTLKHYQMSHNQLKYTLIACTYSQPIAPIAPIIDLSTRRKIVIELRLIFRLLNRSLYSRAQAATNCYPDGNKVIV
jgi:hypothetical protein